MTSATFEFSVFLWCYAVYFFFPYFGTQGASFKQSFFASSSLDFTINQFPLFTLRRYFSFIVIVNFLKYAALPPLKETVLFTKDKHI